jgi:hypothetical protein
MNNIQDIYLNSTMTNYEPPKFNNHISTWLNTNTTEELKIYDYCLDIYHLINSYCIDNNYVINISKEKFIGHLITILYQSYPYA